jgi:hypothetical protein
MPASTSPGWSQERLAPAAWVGSWAQCLAEVALRTGVDSLSDLDSSQLPLAGACREALAALPPAPLGARQEETLASWRELAQAPRKKAQRLLSKRLDDKDYHQLLSMLCDPDAARLRSCGGPLAGAWQLASPGLSAERLDDRDYETTAPGPRPRGRRRRRLQKPPPHGSPGRRGVRCAALPQGEPLLPLRGGRLLRVAHRGGGARLGTHPRGVRLRGGHPGARASLEQVEVALRSARLHRQRRGLAAPCGALLPLWGSRAGGPRGSGARPRGPERQRAEALPGRDRAAPGPH